MNAAPVPALRVRRLGRVAYAPIWQQMKDFVDARVASTPDELWLLEHEPVYTLGLAGDPAHVLNPGDTPVVQTDRGGQVTWHGPGQAVVYVLLDMQRRALGPRELVRLLEEAAIRVLAEYGIGGARRPKAPGVYVDGAKIAALGLRIRRHCSYHGLALNVAPDLAPFRGINPCGYAGLAVTSLAALGVQTTLAEAGTRLIAALSGLLDRRAASAGASADNAPIPAGTDTP
ncbi:MAG TPA: lipoyl(octanoyl) transferase LipB [Gammaproteobacteria bacterium]|nr:lipoyl(octanoyl) transferase LipB [Gammaproteobacteria bacterium]